MESYGPILADFPFQSHYVDVLGSKMHYVEEGSGDPVLFLHGIPTSSYLWRNVIPQVKTSGRCIAPDLIGMGQSDKPDIEYRVFDHIHYLEEFVNALNLKNITLVMHGWGSVIGFDYAMRNQANIKSLVFLEAHLRPIEDWNRLALPVQQLAAELTAVHKTPNFAIDTDYCVNTLIHRGLTRKLSKTELENYLKPFRGPKSFQPLVQYLKDFPLGQKKTDVSVLIENYSQALSRSDIPKLMMYAIPGFNTTVETLQWAQENLKNLSLVDLGEELHYAQETKPQMIGQEISHWCQSISHDY